MEDSKMVDMEVYTKEEHKVKEICVCISYFEDVSFSMVFINKKGDNCKNVCFDHLPIILTHLQQIIF